MLGTDDLYRRHRTLNRSGFLLVLPEAARVELFKQLEFVCQTARERAQAHIDSADALRTAAKGRHFWNDDDEEKQAEALGKVNLAWSYYPVFIDDSQICRMYKIWADMKDELATSQYERVMERDRLRLGRVIEDKR